MDDLDSVRVLTRLQTIEVVGVGGRTWDRLEAAGDTPPKTRLSEGRIGYRVCDLKEWLDMPVETTAQSARFASYLD